METTLSPSHRDAIRKRGIPDNLIDAHGLRSLADGEAKSILGWQPKTGRWSAGIAIPYPAVANQNGTPYVRFRPDFPFSDANERPRKYESPVGTLNRAFFPLGFWQRISDTSTPILVTEGEFKSLAATAAGFACIGLSGVWNWTAKRPRRATGKATGIRTLIPDLEMIHWNGRNVFIVFDSDAAEKDEVRLAERDLAEILRGRGATVRVVRLPGLLPDGKTGLDDFLVHHNGSGATELNKLLAEAETLKDVGDVAVSTQPMALADRFIGEQWMTSDGPKVRHYRDQFHLYLGTHYRPTAEGDVRRTILTYLDGKVDNPTPRLASEVTECAAARLLIPANYERPLLISEQGPRTVPGWIPMSNGIFDLDAYLGGASDCLEPHTPRLFNVGALPYPYEPAATCHAWKAFLGEVFEGDSERINALQEWFGYCVTGETRLHTICLLTGPPRSGKGTTCRMLRSVVGDGNCASPRLATLGETFGLWGLLDKTAAILPDAHVGKGAAAISALEILKAISGEDAIEIHRKNLPSVSARLKTRFTISVNELPRFGDSATALSSRLLIIPFEISFLGREDRFLEERLLPEVSGVFLWACDGLRRLRANGRFTRSTKGESVLGDFGRLTSPVRAFLEDRCVVGGDHCVNRTKLFDAWAGWCDETKNYPGTRESFGSALRSAVPTLDSDQYTAGDGTRQRRYIGVSLLEDGGQG
jgi:putative DNA primase/helicase